MQPQHIWYETMRGTGQFVLDIFSRYAYVIFCGADMKAFFGKNCMILLALSWKHIPSIFDEADMKVF